MDIPDLDHVIFAEFRDTMGHAASLIWIGKFIQTLDDMELAADGAEPDRDQVFGTAHLITARAGLLGCTRLVDACLNLQRVCKLGEDYLKPYIIMREAAADAGPVLRNAL